jgi:hypothetical protein
MANETLYALYTTVAAYVAAFTGPYFRAATVAANNVRALNFIPGSSSIKLPKSGALSAATVAENTAASNSQYSETSVTLTAAKVMVLTELSVEAMEFAKANPDFIAQEQGRAIAAKFDTDALALADGFSNTSGATTTALTIAKIQTALLKLQLGNVPGPYVGMLHPKSVNDVRSDLVASTASVWTNPAEIGLMGGQPQQNGFSGNILGLPIFQTTNTKSVNTAADWANVVLSPQYAIAAAFHKDVVVDTQWDVTKKTLKICSHLFYDVKEYYDAAGIYLIGAQ